MCHIGSIPQKRNQLSGICLNCLLVETSQFNIYVMDITFKLAIYKNVLGLEKLAKQQFENRYAMMNYLAERIVKKNT